MKTRYLILLCLLLILPITLYFTLTNHRVEPPSNANKASKVTEADAIKNPPTQPISQVVEAKPANLPIQQWTTENGVNVYFVETNGIPIVDIAVDFEAGSSRDGAKPGLSHLCTRLLDEGIPELSADEIAVKFENAGVQYNAHADRDRATFSLRSLNDPKLLNPTVELFATLLANPTFPETNVGNIKNQTLIEIKRNLQKPNVVASQAFFKAIYQDHPYAHPGLGTEESVTAITQEDLISFHKQFFVANNAIITLVGGISKEYAQELANQIVKKLLAGNKAEALPKVPALTQAIDQSIAFPTEQTHILIGQPCAIAGDPDYFPLLIGNYILGGNPLSSRLFREIRDKRGLVYHISSALLLLKQSGPFVIKLQTKNDQTKEALGVLKENLLQFVNEGPTDKEVLEAKQGITRALPLEINNNAKIKEFVSNLAFYKLPLDFFNTYSEHINSVSTTDIKAAFQQRIHPETMALIVVGTAPN